DRRNATSGRHRRTPAPRSPRSPPLTTRRDRPTVESCGTGEEGAMPRKSRAAGRAVRTGKSAREQSGDPFGYLEGLAERLLVLRLIVFAVVFTALAVAAIYGISLTHLPEWAITTIEHTLIGLIVAANAAVFI